MIWSADCEILGTWISSTYQAFEARRKKTDRPPPQILRLLSVPPCRYGSSRKSKQSLQCVFNAGFLITTRSQLPPWELYAVDDLVKAEVTWPQETPNILEQKPELLLSKSTAELGLSKVPEPQSGQRILLECSCAFQRCWIPAKDFPCDNNHTKDICRLVHERPFERSRVYPFSPFKET